MWVSSDDDEILAVSEFFGAQIIARPKEISGDNHSSESAWMHALSAIERHGLDVDIVVGIQPTSPLREPEDFDRSIKIFNEKGYDSMLSVAVIEDYFTWRVIDNGSAESVSYDFRNRQRRQNIEKQYLENGSFYLFRPELFRLKNNRLAGNIGLYIMEKYKRFQIDDIEDFKICSSIMHSFGLDRAWD